MTEDTFQMQTGIRKDRLILTTVLIIAALIAFVGCDKSSDPVEEYHFLGITQTDQTGAILGSPDPDDWCQASLGPGNIPRDYALWPAYANPASSSITVKFGLPQEDSVEVYILAWPSKRVKTLVNATRPAGTYALTWNLRNDSDSLLAPDIYRCVMKTATFTCHGDIQILAP